MPWKKEIRGYDFVQSGRFRHATTFQRWRPDREPSSCTYEQLEVPVPMELEETDEMGGTLFDLVARLQRS